MVPLVPPDSLIIRFKLSDGEKAVIKMMKASD